MTTGPATDGALLFARYAYPPNSLGYCGADDPRTLLERTAAEAVDHDLRQTLRTFEGAWPYLELIAHASGIGDPLDAGVVEAYWIGNRLLQNVDPRAMATAMEDRFRPHLGRGWSPLGDASGAGALPHHSFHVLGVYPYVGLLRSGVVDEPLRVLDRCRIRWGRVVEVGLDRTLVRTQPLVWDGQRLHLGPPLVEWVTSSQGGLALARPLAAGDWCSLHWDWLCDRLSPRQAQRLRAYTLRTLDAANHAPATVLA
jgi:hypothetical protein